MRTDGRTDITKLKRAFRNIANMPKSVITIMSAHSEAAILRSVPECYVANFELFKKKHFKPYMEQPLRRISHKDVKKNFHLQSTHFYEYVY